MKKLISAFLMLSFLFLNTIAAYAESIVSVDKDTGKAVIANRSVLKLRFDKDFDINESHEGQEIYFSLAETIKDSDNTVLPAGTKFIGNVTNKENSKWGFRKAKAEIVMDRMILPNGRTYKVKSTPEKGELSSPTGLNIAKGTAVAAVDAGICIFGAAFIAIECLSVGGMIFAPITGAALGVALSSTSKGLNYKVSRGTEINFILNKPIEIDLL